MLVFLEIKFLHSLKPTPPRVEQIKESARETHKELQPELAAHEIKHISVQTACWESGERV